MRRFLYLLFLCCVCFVVTAQNDYDTQRGIELYNQKNYTVAIPYLQKAAKAGSLPALDFLGYMYECGLGVGKDFSVAINLYKKGVEKNYAPCLVNMGRLYENGSGVEQNPEKAFSYYKKAADLGSGDGEYQVSLCKKYGFGTGQNPEEAFEYAEKAANHGWRYEYLAEMYFEGYGTPVDFGKAYEWYTKPDCEYTDKAKLRTAIILANGIDVNKNLRKALSIILDLKKQNSQVEGLDDWYLKINQAYDEKIRVDNIITTPTFSEEAKQYVRSSPEPARPAIESAGRGEIVISCTVTSSGHITNGKIKYRVLQRLDDAALRLVSNMPSLIPGTRGGQPAPLKVDIGVSFFPTRVRIVQCYR